MRPGVMTWNHIRCGYDDEHGSEHYLMNPGDPLYSSTRDLDHYKIELLKVLGQGKSSRFWKVLYGANACACFRPVPSPMSVFFTFSVPAEKLRRKAWICQQRSQGHSFYI